MCAGSQVDEFLVLGSDGLFDVFPNRQDLMNTIKQLLRKHSNVDTVCKLLVREAITERRSADNVSVTIMVFNQFSTSTATAGALGGCVGYAARACARKIHSSCNRNMRKSDDVNRLKRSYSVCAPDSLPTRRHTRVPSNQPPPLGASSPNGVTLSAAAGAGVGTRGGTPTASGRTLGRPETPHGSTSERSQHSHIRTGSRCWTTDAVPVRKGGSGMSQLAPSQTSLVPSLSEEGDELDDDIVVAVD